MILYDRRESLSLCVAATAAHSRSLPCVAEQAACSGADRSGSALRSALATLAHARPSLLNGCPRCLCLLHSLSCIALDSCLPVLLVCVLLPCLRRWVQARRARLARLASPGSRGRPASKGRPDRRAPPARTAWTARTAWPARTASPASQARTALPVRSPAFSWFGPLGASAGDGEVGCECKGVLMLVSSGLFVRHPCARALRCVASICHWFHLVAMGATRGMTGGPLESWLTPQRKCNPLHNPHVWKRLYIRFEN